MVVTGQSKKSGKPGDASPRSHAGRAARRLTAVALVLGLAACGAPPPPPPPTIVALELTASPDVNPTQSGQGAPVVVRVYQLAAAAGFEKAEFFRLLNADAATLGPDLVKKDEYLLAPGTTKKEKLTLPDTVHALGIFAAYREFRTATWRIVVPVPPHETTPVAVTAAAGLAVAPK